MPRSRRLSVFLVTFCLALAVAGCGGGDDEGTDPQPTTTAPATTRTQAEEDEAALRQLAEDWYEAAPSVFGVDGDSSAAERYLVDPYLSQVVAQVDDYRDRGVAVVVDERSSYEIESITFEGDTATLTECIVDGDILIDVETEEVVDEGVSAFRMRTVAIRAGDDWRLSERSTVRTFEGVQQCD